MQVDITDRYEYTHVEDWHEPVATILSHYYEVGFITSYGHNTSARQRLYTYSAFCHQLQRSFAVGSIISVIPVMFRSCIVALAPYMAKYGTPASLGVPVSAKCVMYSCKAIATAVLATNELLPS